MTVTLTASHLGANDMETKDLWETLAPMLQCVSFVYKHGNICCLAPWLEESESKIATKEGKIGTLVCG